MQELSNYWYIFDKNTNTYILRDLEDKDDPVFWDAQPKIRDEFKDVPFDALVCPDLPVGRSMTEYEMQFVMSNPEFLKRARWLKRKFDSSNLFRASEEEKKKHSVLFDDSKDDDVRSKLKDLKKRMTDAFASTGNPEAVKTFSVSLNAYISDANDPQKQNYLKQFKEYVMCMLTDEIYRCADERKKWLLDGCGLGLGGDDAEEMLHHCNWARDKCIDFQGREELVECVLDKISAKNRTKESG
jgi:hypothetical protein